LAFPNGFKLQLVDWLGFEPARKAYLEDPKNKKRLWKGVGEGLIWRLGHGARGLSDAIKSRKTHGHKHMWKGIGNAVLDQFAGRTVRSVVRNLVRFWAIPILAGMLFGSISPILVTGIAFGTANAVYKFAREVVRNHSVKKKSWKGSVTDWRVYKDTALQFAKGFARGAGGAWFIHTAAGEAAVNSARHIFSSAFGGISLPFNHHAHKGGGGGSDVAPGGAFNPINKINQVITTQQPPVLAPKH
jgi:hypothetical protein